MKIVKRIKRNGLEIDISNGRNLVVILPKKVENATLVAACMITIENGFVFMDSYVGSKDRDIAIENFFEKLLYTETKGKLIVAPCLSGLEVSAIKLQKHNIILTYIPLDWNINQIIQHMFERANSKIAEMINTDKINWIRSNQEYEELMQRLYDDEMLQL
ncbi:MAG: hypothetical protein J6U54_03980 [Clostridiales bacterium]|nr:hypothetical protein [Clostridiales bacterium]